LKLSGACRAGVPTLLPAMDFLSSDRSTFSREVRLAGQRQKDDGGTFFWTVLLTLLTGLTIFSWVFCMYVFSNPEKAFNYGLLNRFDKLQPLRDFSPTNAPRGKFYTAKELYSAYFDYSDRELRAVSSLMRRDYVRNYRGLEKVAYLTGSFRLSQIKPLTPGDIVPAGLALRGRSEDYPNIEVEYLLPARELPDVHYDLEVHQLLEIGSSSTCAAVLNLARVADDRLLVTALPIVYGPHETPARTEIVLEVPEALNLYGPIPVTGREPGPETSEVLAVTKEGLAAGE
jgi:hypothetical protein